VTTIINCTSNDLVLADRYDASCILAVFPCAPMPVRLKSSTQPQFVYADGVAVPMVAVSHIETHYLPKPAEGVFYIVPKAVQEARPERTDLLSVFEAHRREDDGKPMRVISFSVRAQSAPVGEAYPLDPVLEAHAEVVRS
jgi:hypothetical protein